LDVIEPRFPRHHSPRASHPQGWSGVCCGDLGIPSDGAARMGDNGDIYFLSSVQPESLGLTANLREADFNFQIESGRYRRSAAVPT
jgi:hypothetical protein